MLERGAQDVLGDDQAVIRSHDEPLGCDGAVGGIAGGLVEDGHGRHQLTDQAKGGVDRQNQAPVMGLGQQFREPDAGRRVRCNRQRLVRVSRPVDAPDAGVIAVAERCEAVDALPQSKLERRHDRKVAAEAESLGARAIGFNDETPFAKSISEGHERPKCANRAGPDDFV